MSTLLKITGVCKLISFYRYIYLNGPGVTKFSGIGLILVIGLTHLYVFPEHFEAAPYFGLSFSALFAGTLLSALGILRGSRWGWALGSVICGFAFGSDDCEVGEALYVGFLFLSEDHDNYVVALTCKNPDCRTPRTGIKLRGAEFLH